MNFFNWFFINEKSIWTLNILIPHAVDPAQPPINISIKKNIKEKLPHLSNSCVTYPVPESIEITLKEEILILSNMLASYFVNNN